MVAGLTAAAVVADGVAAVAVVAVAAVGTYTRLLLRSEKRHGLHITMI